MNSDIVRFLRSIPTNGWLRIGMAMVVTTLSVRMAFGERATAGMLVGCILVTLVFAFRLEYKSYKERR